MKTIIDIFFLYHFSLTKISNATITIRLMVGNIIVHDEYYSFILFRSLHYSYKRFLRSIDSFRCLLKFNFGHIMLQMNLKVKRFHSASFMNDYETSYVFHFIVD